MLDVVRTVRCALEGASGTLGRPLAANQRPGYQGKFPYYKPAYGMAVKTAVDHILVTGEPFLLERGSRGQGTFRNLVSQARMYLIEVIQKEADNTTDYQHVLEHVLVGKHTKKGYLLMPASRADALQGFPVRPWREDFLNWVSSSQVGEVFERRGIAITEDDKTFLLRVIMPLKGKFISDVSDSHVLVHRVQP